MAENSDEVATGQASIEFADDHATPVLANKAPAQNPGLAKVKYFLRLMLKSALIALAIVAVGTYIFFSPPILTAFNGDFILFPLPAGPEFMYDTINGVTREDVYFNNKHGDKLNGWYFQNPNANAPVVLFSHGNGGNLGNRVHLMKALMDAGASVFIYDYRQYGKSEGVKSLQGLTADADAAMDYLLNTKKIEPERIVLYGESIGGGPSCYLLAHHKVKALILDSTFTSLMGIARKKVSYFYVYPDFLAPNPSFDNRSVIMGEHPPLLIVHGQKDDLIPSSEAVDNFRNASEPKQLLLLPQSDHNDKGKDFGTYADGLKKFLQSL